MNQPQWLNPYIEFKTQKRIEAKALHKWMNNAAYGKTMEKLRNTTDVRVMSNEKYYIKWTSKPSYVSQKTFDNNLVTIPKSKVILTLNKWTYVGMCKEIWKNYEYASSIMVRLKISMVTT